MDDTIAALSTPLGPSALAVVRVTGPRAVEIVARTWRASAEQVLERAEPRRLVHGRIADATGGKVWEASSSKDLQATFLSILSEMQSAYLLTYEPTGVKREGWHRIEVKVKNGRGKVRTRSGYFVPPRGRR